MEDPSLELGSDELLMAALLRDETDPLDEVSPWAVRSFSRQNDMTRKDGTEPAQNHRRQHHAACPVPPSPHSLLVYHC